MAHPGARSHHDTRTAVVDAPAELDVFAVEVDRVVEPAELAEQVGTHHQARGRQDEDVADAVVLFLVDLAAFDGLVDHAEAIETESDAAQHAGIVPFDELRSDGSGVRSVQLLDHQANGARVGRHVVVAEQEEPVLRLRPAG